MSKKFTFTIVLIFTLVGSSFAGIRAPGKYSGVVVFDRWDTCYLYSGIYVMYVSQKTKEGLRQYEGKSVEIDAKEVSQPINPGDGLIGKYEFLSFAKPSKLFSDENNLTATVTPEFNDANGQKFIFELRNNGNKKVCVSVSDLAMTLLGVKSSGFSPSDGLSEALVTRQELNGKVRVGNREWFLNVESSPLSDFVLNAQESRRINISFKLPEGEYDFLGGYGGGVHEDKGIASNRVSFNVDAKGNATLAEATCVETRRTEQFNGREAETATFFQRLLYFFGLA